MPNNTKQPLRPAQEQARQPGRESELSPHPRSQGREYRSAQRLTGRAVLITGGDSGIGRAVAIACAKEGASVAISYLEEHADARETAELVAATGARSLLLPGDVGDESVCRTAVERTVAEFGRLDVLISNAAEQHPQEDAGAVTADQVERTFRTNVFAAFHLVRHALPHLGSGSAIIFTSSVVAYRGSAHLLDYAATKGALIALTRSLSLALVDRGIRVNAVAPGPIWTPLIPATFDAEHVASFGSDVPMGRAGEPDEVAPAFVFLASGDSSYMTGQCLHVNGGEVING